MQADRQRRRNPQCAGGLGARCFCRLLDLFGVVQQPAAFAGRISTVGKPISILVNSAGIMATPLARDEAGHESQFATNHLGHFRLVAGLWPALVKASNARVVSVSSRGHQIGPVDFEDIDFQVEGLWPGKDGKCFVRSRT
ncbi:SDR family NAD(P)-dependent oxidoreductase [Agrobacterium tumefaciens]|uniref:SDR family NAD(P)-dependent oxidoreductase n=1 Tax=Agrobacterium tumefaciens TaxID=358 RepID=UPI00287E048E|nr:SDR family NAD(P)-dependent oxidoreductase [Agrobacterium tumefaciens]MDS7598371.1 SDR family NAD(P)-dependent oxidoreductase [Agrobacterium tumefaciens]